MMTAPPSHQPPDVPTSPRLSTEQASRALGIKPQTLYAYVSRGLLHSEPARSGRGSTFDQAEVAALAAGGRRAAAPNVDRVPAPEGNQPLTSSTLITAAGGGLYRGESALALARSRTFEQASALMWTGETPARVAWRPDPAALRQAVAVQAPLAEATMPLERLRVAVAAAGAAPAAAWPKEQSWSAPALSALCMTMIAAVPPVRPELAGVHAIAGGEAPVGSVAARLWVRLCPSAPAPGLLDVLNGLLVLLAAAEAPEDTEGAALAARSGCASWECLLVVLALSGNGTEAAGAMTAAQFLREVGQPASAGAIIDDYLAANRPVPGFGHPLHPAGDPNARFLLSRLRMSAGADAYALPDAVQEAMEERGLPHPNLSFALAAVTHATAMIPGAPAAILAVARCARWLAIARDYAAALQP